MTAQSLMRCTHDSRYLVFAVPGDACPRCRRPLGTVVAEAIKVRAVPRLVCLQGGLL